MDPSSKSSGSNRPGTLAERMPHTLLMLLGLLVVFAAFVPWILPGHFLAGAPVSLDSYQPGATPLPLALFGSGDERGVLNAVFDGLTSGGRNGAAVGVIAFVLLVGGSFGVIQASGVFERSLGSIVRHTERWPAALLVALVTLFSLGGAVFGMGEETIAFVAILLPLLRAMGFGAEVAVMCTYLASQIGFATSWMNPFSVGIAQGLAGLPLMSGSGFRMVMWGVFTVCTSVFVVRHAFARRRQTAPATPLEAPVMHRLQALDVVLLLAIVGTIAWIIWGVSTQGHYIAEIATQFLALGLFAGVASVLTGRLGANQACEAFVEGARQLVPCVLVIGLAKGLLGLWGGTDPHQPSILNSLLFSVGTHIQAWPDQAAAQGMLWSQALFTCVITSGSAQAAITMPLMSGLGDIAGVSRQIAVLSFQLGDGLVNLVVPTGAALMGALGMARVEWLDWWRAVWRFLAFCLMLASCSVALAMFLEYQ